VVEDVEAVDGSVDRDEFEEVVAIVELLDVDGTEVVEAVAGTKSAKAVLFIICAPNSMYPVGQFVQC
jgi:hypothetical protein